MRLFLISHPKILMALLFFLPLVFAALVFVVLTAYPPDLPKKHKPIGEPFMSAHESLAFGRQSAAYYHLSRVWEIKEIDNMPVSRPAHLDLTQLGHGRGLLVAGHRCPPISVIYDTKNISTGYLYVRGIERMINNCSDEFEDKLMSIVADTRRLNKNPNGQLLLVSYGHTLTLSPAEPRP